MAVRGLLRRGVPAVLFCMDPKEECALGGSYAKLACKTGLRTLIFVRRDVAYCSAVARATAALLGRFLPRLGPLAPASGPFFVRRGLFGSRPIGAQLLERDFAQSLRQSVHIGCQVVESRRMLIAALIHVEGPVNFELDGMKARGGVAVVFCDESASVRLVAAHRIPKRPQRSFNGLGHDPNAARAIPVA